jgi:hypothetical protein
MGMGTTVAFIHTIDARDPVGFPHSFMRPRIKFAAASVPGLTPDPVVAYTHWLLSAY